MGECGSKVSILVVVDQAFQEFHPFASFRERNCFNPCCRGSGIPGGGYYLNMKKIQSFNPCCRGSGIPGVIELAENSPHPRGFNPCCRGSGIPGRRPRRDSHQV
ncbi:hypothetical protein HRM2_05640 [Desulforapulum autotrophicum HRM2]|uniref:Uncharacterized protein n=1 Tax=Desulforapulum autotrophicum (strain ATCC 43914 / DSM 3382 / VKM B-1955 / HRM2) TaxID=177437 RepID=C0QHX0_DESAH|nr:hypothetical protein HRM2_05640 [Desulforapulum autotrophicum HRM2]